MSTSTPTADKIEFPTHVSPIGIYFALVSSLTIAFAVLTLFNTRLPIVLVILLFAVAGCCVVLLKKAIEEMGAVTIEWSNQGLTVKGLLGSANYNGSVPFQCSAIL